MTKTKAKTENKLALVQLGGVDVVIAITEHDEISISFDGFEANCFKPHEAKILAALLKQAVDAIKEKGKFK